MRNQPRTSPTLAGLALTSILGFSLSLFFSSAVNAQVRGPLVEAVNVIGNRRLASEDILKHVKTRAGDSYSEDLVKRDFDAVLKLGWFDKTQSRVIRDDGRSGGVVIVFQVLEIPLIFEVSFEGLGEVKESELIDAFRRQNIKVAKDYVYEPVEIRKAIRTIKEIFAARGWPDYAVTARQEHMSASYTSIRFVVEHQARF